MDFPNAVLLADPAGSWVGERGKQMIRNTHISGTYLKEPKLS